MTNPAVSVVLPVHNGMPHFEEAVHSILDQTFANFELVIGDDGSDDGTGAAAAQMLALDPRIRVVSRTQKSGVAAAANWAVGESRAPLVAMMHADDLSLPDRLERQLQIMTERPDCVLTGGVVAAIDWHGQPAHPVNLWRLAFPSPFAPMAHSSIMFRREAFNRAGGYRTARNYWEDLDLYWRMAELGSILVSSRPLTVYRYSRISIRERDPSVGVETALDAMYSSAAAIAEGRSRETEARLPARRIHPRIFVARSWTKVWAGERAHLLTRLLRRGRLRFDRDTFASAVFLAWATASPRSLRGALRLVTRLRNVIARRRLGGAEFVEWRPLDPRHFREGTGTPEPRRSA